MNITEIRRLTLAPGDIILIRLENNPTAVEVHRLEDRARKLTKHPVIIAGPNVEKIELISEAKLNECGYYKKG